MTVSPDAPALPDDPFDDPGESGFFGGETKTRLNGSLLCFEVHEAIADLPTAISKPGEKNPAVRATVHVLDGEHKGEMIENALIFGGIVTSLQNKIDKVVLGRLGKGEAKQGKSAPWVLKKATPEERAAGAQWYRARQAQNDPFAA